MRKYEATFTVTVEMTVEDEIIDRTQEEEWKNSLYDLDEAGTVEMLARCCGIWEQSLDHLDGWADAANNQLVINDVDIYMDGFTRTDIPAT